jgi:2-polyprenyl-3-methyl-5-hydroxy-6-metoxy-1,4-benzoquinol methylase
MVGQYDDYAVEYRAYVAKRERGGVDSDPLGMRLLDLLGDVGGLRVLDAGCGDGYLARMLAARRARVTGVDISPRLIEMARRLDRADQISYLVADLTAPGPVLAVASSFDAAASYLVLDDLEDYRGFAATLGAVLKPGGRLVLAFNNPYGGVIRKHVADYFDSGATHPYRRLWAAGVKTCYHHRTLQEYFEAFGAAGLIVTRLVDLPARASVPGPDTILPAGTRFPRFMLLALVKP